MDPRLGESKDKKVFKVMTKGKNVFDDEQTSKKAAELHFGGAVVTVGLSTEHDGIIWHWEAKESNGR